MMLGHPSSEGKLRQVVTLRADPCLFQLPVLFLVSPFLAWHVQTLLDARGLAQHSWSCVGSWVQRVMVCKWYGVKPYTWLPSKLLDKEAMWHYVLTYTCVCIITQFIYLRKYYFLHMRTLDTDQFLKLGLCRQIVAEIIPTSPLDIVLKLCL